MNESNFAHHLEAEIAELNREIEAKRSQLEREKGIVEERAVVHEVVAEHVYNKPELTPTIKTVSSTPSDDYLVTLDADTVNTVNGLISEIPTLGIKKVIAKAQNEQPLILDAFHDALVTKLYEELKNRGLVS